MNVEDVSPLIAYYLFLIKQLCGDKKVSMGLIEFICFSSKILAKPVFSPYVESVRVYFLKCWYFVYLDVYVYIFIVFFLCVLSCNFPLLPRSTQSLCRHHCLKIIILPYNVWACKNKRQVFSVFVFAFVNKCGKILILIFFFPL